LEPKALPPAKVPKPHIPANLLNVRRFILLPVLPSLFDVSMMSERSVEVEGRYWAQTILQDTGFSLNVNSITTRTISENVMNPKVKMTR
jgi:hypothetical protein